MEKIINIDGKDIRFKTSASTFLKYRAQFGRDGLKELYKLSDEAGNLDISNLDTDILMRFAWAFAKTADKDILPFEDWLDEFDYYFAFDIAQEIVELINDLLRTNNKKK